MTSPVNSVNLNLQLDPGPGYDPVELDRLTRQFLSEVQELPVESAGLVTAVSVLPAVAPKLIDLLQSWIMRGENRTVKIKAQVQDRSIELEYSPSAMPPADVKRLVNSLTDALSPSSPAKS
jgi:hypothetical protein